MICSILFNKANISLHVDRLEVDGLVRRVPDGDDRRSKRATISAEGRGGCEAGLMAQRAVERRLPQGLSAKEQVRLASGWKG